MDGLDDMMAEIEAEQSRKKSEAEVPKSVARPPTSVGVGAVVVALAPAAVEDETQRRLVARLQQLRLDLVDPLVREGFAADLSQRDPQEAFGYYLARPELAQYTVQREVPRLVYCVTAREGGAAVCGADAVTAMYAADAQRRGLGEDRGPEVLWRIANQSVFAEALEVMHRRVVKPHDDGGTLCLGVGTDGVEFQIDFARCSLRATCSLPLTTVTDGGASRLALARVALAVEAEVSGDGARCLKFSQVIEALKPEFVVDEQLAAAAKTLAEFSPEELDAQQEPASDFAALRAASALGDATSSALGAAAIASASVLGGLKTLSMKAAAAATSVAEEAAAAKASADSSQRETQREKDELDELFDDWEAESAQPEASAPAAGGRAPFGVMGLLDRLATPGTPASPSASATGVCPPEPADASLVLAAPGGGTGRAPFGVMGLLDRLAGPARTGSAGAPAMSPKVGGGSGDQEQNKDFSDLFDRLG